MERPTPCQFNGTEVPRPPHPREFFGANGPPRITAEVLLADSLRSLNSTPLSIHSAELFGLAAFAARHRLPTCRSQRFTRHLLKARRPFLLNWPTALRAGSTSLSQS
eukprot:5914192-Prymnesium_polylepis.1